MVPLLCSKCWDQKRQDLQSPCFHDILGFIGKAGISQEIHRNLGQYIFLYFSIFVIFISFSKYTVTSSLGSFKIFYCGNSIFACGLLPISHFQICSFLREDHILRFIFLSSLFTAKDLKVLDQQ